MKITLPTSAVKSPSKSKTEYPVVVLTKQVDGFLQAKSVIDTNTAILSVAKEAIVSAAKRKFVEKNTGATSITNSVAVEGNDGQVLVTFKSRYPVLNEAQEKELLDTVPSSKHSTWFSNKLTLSLDGDKVEASKRQAFVDDLVALLQKYDSVDALSARQVLVPTEVFENERWRLPKEENAKLDEFFPMQAQCSARPSLAKKAK